jgi:hypothetical protein
MGSQYPILLPKQIIKALRKQVLGRSLNEVVMLSIGMILIPQVLL